MQLWDELNRLTRWLKTIGTTYDVDDTLADLEYRVRTIRGSLDEAGFQAVIRTFEAVPFAEEPRDQSDAKDFILGANSSASFFADIVPDEEDEGWIAEGSPTIEEWGAGFSTLIEVNPNVQAQASPCEGDSPTPENKEILETKNSSGEQGVALPRSCSAGNTEEHK